MKTLLIGALWSLQLLSAATRMSVAVCNSEEVYENIVAMAQKEASSMFRSAGVTILWRPCGDFPASTDLQYDPWFVLRVLPGSRLKSVGHIRLDIMGRAFVDEHGGGKLADVYVEAIRYTSGMFDVDPALLLGVVMAHELGHLLLGAGHSADGVMQAFWGLPQMIAVRQRRLRFADARIRRALETLSFANK